MTRIAFFCNLKICAAYDPQANMPYVRCGKINEQYKVLRTGIGKYVLTLHKIPILRDILREILSK
jgi:hypothetical protein